MKNQSDVAEYLKEAKELISENRYSISKRKKNDEIDSKYVIDSKRKKAILLSLEVEDFCQTLNNEHYNYKDEILYVFGKDITLLNRFGEGKTNVSLYIKMNKIPDKYIYVISFHEQQYKLMYPFK